MKTPAPPPAPTPAGNLAEVISHALTVGAAPWSVDLSGKYLPWDKFRFKEPPEGLTVEEWWHLTRLARRASSRSLTPLRQQNGQPFTFALPDEVLRATEEIASHASGEIGMSELVANEDTRRRYVVNSLFEEAITSSQLEGAATSRREAKAMLRTGREPRDNSERMIVNNYLAMERVRELVDAPLSPDLVRELHRIVTEGTLDNPGAAGQLQDDNDLRVSVWGDGDQLLYRPPPVEELPTRLQALCDFANGTDGGPYMPTVLRAVTIHFMVGYDHYFEDGNGRTARALFYWSMLRGGYWMTEYMSISRILRLAKSKYAQSFLVTEDDEGDLTHFFIYHLGIIQRAIRDLHTYLDAKSAEVRDVQVRLRSVPGEFNYRQLAIIENAVRDAGGHYTINSHRRSHMISVETARQDLMGLQRRGLLDRVKVGRQFVWVPVDGLSDKLGRQSPANF